MRMHTCHLDHHQRVSLGHDHDWTRGNDELGSTVEQQPVGKIVRQSCGEVQRATFSQLTQPKPKPICDRSGKPDNLSENTRVEQTHDGSGQPDERNSSSAHTVKEQFAPEGNRDIALFNTDNEFNRGNQRGEHRLQHSRTTTFCSETITWCQRSKFDSEDREPPSSTCTSKRSSTTSTIQSLQQRIKRHD